MKKFILFVSILFFYGCEKVINIETEYSNERVVIDASLFKNIKEDFANAIVKVSKTAPYFSENNTVIEDAVVFIKTKNGNIKLNFNTEKKYYTNTIDYINFEENYELLINYKEQNYYSFEKIIQIPEIESVTFGTRKSLQKDEVELLITFTDPAGIGNYYLWKFGPKGIDNKYDYLITTSHNQKGIPNRGSAIFLHLTNNYKPTAGCIALKKKDFEILIKLIDKKTKIKIG